MRCVLEAQQHQRNSFITLTYNDEHLPKDQSLDKTHLQKFFKRLRKQHGPFRYYACGEYGDTTQRAHYHACLFGMDFDDKTELRKIKEITLYHSQALDRLWGYGFTSVGELTFESAQYCAKYVLKKKLTVQRNRQSHFTLCTETGELVPVIQPFAVMSLGRGPGNAIGGPWLKRFHQDIYTKDHLVMRGKKMKPAKYFDQVYDQINSKHMEEIKKQREENREERTVDELRAHEQNTRARIIQRRQI